MRRGLPPVVPDEDADADLDQEDEGEAVEASGAVEGDLGGEADEDEGGPEEAVEPEHRKESGRF